MRGSRRLLRLLTLGMLLALAPAAAARYYELNASGRGAHGFTLRLRHATVYDFPGVGLGPHSTQPIYRDAGSVVLSRTAKGQTLSRRLQAAKGAKITAARGLKHARVRLRFGSRGRVDLRFSPTGKLKDLGPDNCVTSALLGRRGVFRGTSEVKMGGVFHTLRRTTFRGTLAVDGTGHDCSERLPGGGGDHLAVKAAGSSAIFHTFGTGIGRLTLPGRHGRGWLLHDEIAADAPNTTVTDSITLDDSTEPPGAPTGAASAHVQLSGPFLTGTLDFTHQPGFPAKGDPGYSTEDRDGYIHAPGPVSGSLTVNPGRLGSATVTVRPRTGRLTYGDPTFR